MRNTIEVGEHTLEFQFMDGEELMLSRDVDFLNESNASLYFPDDNEALPSTAAKYLLYLQRNYPEMREKSCEAIAFIGKNAGTWKMTKEDMPQLHLVYVKLLPKSFNSFFSCFEICYTDPEKDVYGAWITTFKDSTLFGVRREDW